MIHDFIVTNLLGCDEMEMVSLLVSLREGRLNPGFVPRPEAPGFPSKTTSQVLPIRSQYLCPGDHRPFKDIQGYTVTGAKKIAVNGSFLPR